MGRGLGRNNLSEDKLKEAKAKRDKKYYEAHLAENKKKRALLVFNAETINCGCGGNYKDIVQNRNSHFLTHRHSLWDEEEEKQVKELICKKVKGINTIEEAQSKLDVVYLNAERYTYLQKECYIPKLLIRLNKMADKVVEPPPPPPPPPPKPKKLKLKIKRKLNIINE